VLGQWPKGVVAWLSVFTLIKSINLVCISLGNCSALRAVQEKGTIRPGGLLKTTQNENRAPLITSWSLAMMSTTRHRVLFAARCYAICIGNSSVRLPLCLWRWGIVVTQVGIFWKKFHGWLLSV